VNLSEVSMLYVEDEDIVREIMCSFIRMKYPSIPIYSAGTSEEGLALFRQHHPSIIITDINLAEADGIQMVRAIRRLDPNTIIIFVTGCSDVERLLEFGGGAACHYICKPIDHKELFALLDRHIPLEQITVHTM